MRASLQQTLPSSSVPTAPAHKLYRPYVLSARRGRTASNVQARAARYDRKRPPPPDLPSLLFDQRIVYMGMPVSGSCGGWRGAARFAHRGPRGLAQQQARRAWPARLWRRCET